MPEQSTATTTETHPLEIKSILLLDDDIDLADTLKHLLESHNFVVTTVKNGVEGLHEIMRLDFDIIMCDMLMPAMAGDMFYIAVQRTKPHLCERFIFITGHADNPKVTEFLSKVDALALYKPVPSEDLIRTISFVLKKTSDAAKEL
jgi:CheY-like chemotaxis protein